jgi:GT2 family glycosyltransferase
MNKISIIIVDYNTPADVKEAVESILSSSLSSFKIKIIIVDNGSKIPLKLPKSILKQNVEIIRSEANLGFTGGNNLGISYAIRNYQPDYFLLINPDTIVKKNFLVELYKTLLSHPQAGIACSKIYFYKDNEYHKKSYLKSQRGKVLWYGGGSIDWENFVADHRGVDEVDRGQLDHQTQSDFCTGCCILIKREIIEKIGLLDKKFFLYSEDVDFCLRVKKAGFKNMFSPNSVIWHKNAASSGGAGNKVQMYYQTRNRILLVFKHGSLRNKILIFRLIFQLLAKGNSFERKAVKDFFLGKFGKQPIL